MPVAWFIVPYKRRPRRAPVRYCAMDDFTPEINMVGGAWSETEVLGNQAVVKVRAPEELLSAIEKASGFFRLPLSDLSAPLSSLAPNVRGQLRGRLLAAGYSPQEVNARFGDDLVGYTLKDFLSFLATRRQRPRYDQATDTIHIDGRHVPCRPVEAVNADVTE